MIFKLLNIPDYEGELQRLHDSEGFNVGDSMNDFFHNITHVGLPPWFFPLAQTLLYVLIGAIVLWIIYKEFQLNSGSSYVTTDTIRPSDIPFGGSAEDADIRGHHFLTELSNALVKEDYALAVNLRYLMSLQMLDQKGRIEWRKDKTPMVYIAELKDGKDSLHQLTKIFLYIKYGHYPATKEVYDEAVLIYSALEKGGEGGES